MKGISAIIPNYNGKDLLPQILPSLFTALNNSQLPYEVIISDDRSTDESVQLIRNEFPAVSLIINDRNLGFSATMNAGIRIAKYDLVLLLNSDVKLSPDYFKRLISYFDIPDTFGVMGRIVGWDDDIIQDGAKYPNFHGTKIKTTGNYLPIDPQPEDRLYSMYLSGANALVDRKKLLLLGGFDEIFSPFYVEDYEMSLRAWRLGFKCYYDYYSVCRHKVSISIKSNHKKKFINTIYYRNKMFLHAIHLNGGSFVIWYLQNFFEVLIQSLIGKSYHLKAFRKFVSATKKWKESERKFNELSTQLNTKLTVVQVAEIINGSIKNKKIRKF